MKKLTGLFAFGAILALVSGCGNNTDDQTTENGDDTLLIIGDHDGDFVDESDYLMDVVPSEDADGELESGIGSLLPGEDEEIDMGIGSLLPGEDEEIVE